ncbi:hypothetical protein Tco_0695343 [Tanacetum coccineum]
MDSYTGQGVNPIVLLIVPSVLPRRLIDKFKTGLGYNAASSTAASPAVESFVNSSEMLENQENNKSKSDKGYHAVPPLFIGNFMPRKPDLTNVKTAESNLESAGVKNNGDAVEPKTIRKNSFRPPVIEDWNSDDESEVEIIPKDKTVSSSTEKIKLVKTARETVEKIETSKQNKHYPRGNQRNWNNLMSQRLGSDFKMINKACFVCGSFEHLHYVCDKKFASQVYVNNDLPKPVTPHYLPKVRESVLAKPNHVITPGLSRNSSKESYGSNDMAHNYYLEEAKKKTQDKNRNLKPREMPSARTHHSLNTCTEQSSNV